MRTEQLRYLLLLAALVIVSAALTNSLMVAVILFAPELNRLLVPTIVKGKRLLGIFAWVCCDLALAWAYYIADFLLFPRSPYASHRERDAIVMAIVGMVGGFATIYWMPASRAGAKESRDI